MRTRKIRSLADFIEVPEAELTNCVRSLRHWIDEQKMLRADAQANGRTFQPPQEFLWRQKAVNEKTPLQCTPTTPILELGLRFAAVAACMQMRIFALEDFSDIEASELAKVPNVGQSTVVKVREMLRSVGLDFRKPANAQRRAYDRAKAVRAGQKLANIDDQDHVVELDLKTVISGRLMSKGITTVGQLRRMTPRDLGMMFGTAGGQHVVAKLRESGLDFEPPPKQLDLWRYHLVPLEHLARPDDNQPIQELEPWLGAVASAAQRAGLATVGDLRRLAKRGPTRVRGIGEYGWRRLAEYFGVVTERPSIYGRERPNHR
ncbi:hypothetical protein [Caenimonas aquaedulcis]|uniref:RNA polymerase alpha subunit C-terminal domain-containing protein n=1 Tax=Caenimonas aquaedulcis TaxID=2793270 RepID=A0A931H615_9BURK|nr:hypothetical protein [Caenimonas aquaedulcis]MBG9389319.1 hypothetical protein [Caenimonas aquaedulcis]